MNPLFLRRVKGVRTWLQSRFFLVCSLSILGVEAKLAFDLPEIGGENDYQK